MKTFLKSNSPLILTSFAITGVISTAVLASKATIISKEIIDKEKEEHQEDLSKKDLFLLTWRLYVPTTLSAVTTIASILALHRVGVREAAAATALYTLTNDTFRTYREKVVEKIGEKEERKLNHKVSETILHENPPSKATIFLGNNEDTLFYDRTFGRYFKTSVESVRRAENSVNHMVQTSGEASAEDLYDFIGVEAPPISSGIGWGKDELLNLRFQPILAENDTPCICLDYNYISISKWTWG